METRTEKIQDFLESLNIDNIDIPYCIDAENVNSFEDMEQAIEDNYGFNVDVIYYHTALKYLMEHDASLLESTELAYEMGYETRDINSELLASLLASQKCREDFYNHQDEIESFFEELEEQIEV